MLQRGQIVPILLISLTAFLYLERGKKDWGAGLFLAIAMVKPHAVYLFWISLGFWTLYEKRWKILVSFMLSLTAISLIPVAFHPHIFGDYIRDVVKVGSTYQWPTPTWSTLSHFIFGGEPNWIKYIPAMLGIGWVTVYWMRHRKIWRWAENIHSIIFMSLITNIYIWSSDYALCLIPLTQATVLITNLDLDRRILFSIILYLGMNIAAWIICILVREDFFFIWMIPCLLLNYYQFKMHLGSCSQREGRLVVWGH
jgi:hypothetical protein